MHIGRFSSVIHEICAGKVGSVAKMMCCMEPIVGGLGVQRERCIEKKFPSFTSDTLHYSGIQSEQSF